MLYIFTAPSGKKRQEKDLVGWSFGLVKFGPGPRQVVDFNQLYNPKYFELAKDIGNSIGHSAIKLLRKIAPLTRRKLT